MMVRSVIPFLAALMLAAPPAVLGRGDDDFGELSLEELLDVPVFSAAKQAVPMSETAAAVYVITADDIRRFGFPNVPEALRMVPGVNVARIDAMGYAVTIRGYNGRYSNKLLVMVDGRSIYSALFSGVIWELGIPMNEIRHIEVIRGPGSTLWGANAVNGVINIITKSTRDTDGGLVDVRAGDLLEASIMGRYGRHESEGPSFRAYGQYDRLAPLKGVDGVELHDGGETGVGGARLEWSDGDFVSRFEVVGKSTRAGYVDSYPASLEPPYAAQADEKSTFDSVALIYAAERNGVDGSGFKLNVHGEANRLDSPILGADIRRFGLDWSRHFAAGRHTVVWGGGYRLDEIEYRPTFTIDTSVDDAQDWRLDFFLQDAVTVAPDRLSITLGAKIEYGSLADFGIQPNLRALWMPHHQHTVWGAAARSLRTPNVINRETMATAEVLPPGTLGPGAPVTRARVVGNPDYESEKLMAYEVGYRHMPVGWFAVDVAAFYNVYHDLSSLKTPVVTPNFFVPTPHLLLDAGFSNGAEGETWGGEVALDLRPAPWWRLRSSWSLLRSRDTLVNTEADDRPEMDAATVPEHEFNAWTSFDLGSTVGLEAAWRYVDAVKLLDVPAYSELDLRLRWQLRAGLEVSVAGYNLLAEEHNEYLTDEIATRERAVIPRCFTAGLRWEF